MHKVVIFGLILPLCFQLIPTTCEIVVTSSPSWITSWQLLAKKLNLNATTPSWETYLNELTELDEATISRKFWSNVENQMLELEKKQDMLKNRCSTCKSVLRVSSQQFADLEGETDEDPFGDNLLKMMKQDLSILKVFQGQLRSMRVSREAGSNTTKNLIGHQDVGNVANDSLNDKQPVDNELNQRIEKLTLENSELRMSTRELTMQNSNLKLELFYIKKQEKLQSDENSLTNMNCSGLTDHIDTISNSLKALWEDVQSVKPYVGEKVVNYTKKFGKIKKSLTVENSNCNCFSKSSSVLTLTDDKLFQTACDTKTLNGKWTVIQRRMNGKTNFYRPWVQYRNGFGDVSDEFFIGLENLHLLTTCARQELLIEMEDFDNQKKYAKYDLFEIGSENESYSLKEIGPFTGDAGDSLIKHKSQKFSTYDHDNDESPFNCAQTFKGAWWHRNCHDSNLNGEYANNNYGEGVNWITTWGYKYSLKFVEMKVRPSSNQTIF